MGTIMLKKEQKDHLKYFAGSYLVNSIILLTTYTTVYTVASVLSNRAEKRKE